MRRFIWRVFWVEFGFYRRYLWHCHCVQSVWNVKETFCKGMPTAFINGDVPGIQLKVSNSDDRTSSSLHILRWVRVRIGVMCGEEGDRCRSSECEGWSPSIKIGLCTE
jgi:hypothetical protein